ncbi:hypothetical protein Pmani_015380 [Petrolisthes manimaculis]|uniref:Uncharacterized protein n=1 Tax=Petrolisthes manimaculis TaxID=1843537 RepID=A0AAE1UC41_9EUCA|nr:hypothetical protein Pmani_015380 [Petrolisthes manimaculis]
MTKKFPQLGETLRTREVKETQRGDELPTSPKKKKNASKPVVLPPPQEEVLIEKSQNREKANAHAPEKHYTPTKPEKNETPRRALSGSLHPNQRPDTVEERILSQISQYTEDPTVEHLRTPSQRWELDLSEHNNEAGLHLAIVLEEADNICLLNSGVSTHQAGGRLDLTFVSRDLGHCSKWVTRVLEAGFYDFWTDSSLGNFTTCRRSSSKITITSDISLRNIWVRSFDALGPYSPSLELNIA